MRFVPILHTQGDGSVHMPPPADPYLAAAGQTQPLVFTHCLFDGERETIRVYIYIQKEGEDESDRRRQPHRGAAATGVTRRPFIKCYPGCINLISFPLLLLPGWEICYGWRLKDLSLESGWWMRWRRQRRNQWITRENLTRFSYTTSHKRVLCPQV